MPDCIMNLFCHSIGHVRRRGFLTLFFLFSLRSSKRRWRVIERSDLIVQIVDARNPLLFRCRDLERYVSKVRRKSMILRFARKMTFFTYHMPH
jgi:ribosome biogenesis GTPase A